MCVCAAECSRLPSNEAAHASLPLEHTEGDPEPWHVAVLGPVLAPGWDVPQVRVPERWLFLAGRGEEQAQPFPLSVEGVDSGGLWGFGGAL